MLTESSIQPITTSVVFNQKRTSVITAHVIYTQTTHQIQPIKMNDSKKALLPVQGPRCFTSMNVVVSHISCLNLQWFLYVLLSVPQTGELAKEFSEASQEHVTQRGLPAASLTHFLYRFRSRRREPVSQLMLLHVAFAV